MAYQYKLEHIRHLRERERQLAQWQYFEALQKLEEAEAKLSEALAKQDEAEQFSQPPVETPLSVQHIQDYENYLNFTRQITEQRKHKRDQLQKRAQTEQSHLQKRRITEEMMNKLRETDYANYCLKEKRKDQGLMDEIAVTRYGRNMAGGGVP